MSRADKARLTSGKVGVVVVTFNPEGDWSARLKGWADQGEALVVVDNASNALVQEDLRRMCECLGCTLIANGENRGLGAALNQGALALAAVGCDWVLCFDQDSEPAPNMSAQLLESVRRHPEPDQVAVVGANFHEPAINQWHRFLRPHPGASVWFQKCELRDRDMEVTMVITSGSLVRLSDFRAEGGFNEGFFIDYIDTDFCLRCRTRGRRILASVSASFNHELGLRTTTRWCGMTVRATNHSALRHYYVARNRVHMWRLHARTHLHWVLFDLCATGLWIGRVLVAESAKRFKIRAMVYGTWDGLLGRVGPCPEKRRVFFRP